jgi:hypothetical protein
MLKIHPVEIGKHRSYRNYWRTEMIDVFRSHKNKTGLKADALKPVQILVLMAEIALATH